jgi:hypothetical protein
MAEAYGSQMDDYRYLDNQVTDLQSRRATAAAGGADQSALDKYDSDIVRASTERDNTGDRLANAYGNLKKFVGTPSTGPPIVGEDGALTGQNMGGSTSASWKTEQAAKAALAAIQTSHGVDGGTGTLGRRPYSGGNGPAGTGPQGGRKDDIKDFRV